MLTTKFDLYKGEWLDLVFSNRNKSYGAYDLRKHYNTNLLKAMAIAFSAVAAGVILVSLTMKSNTESVSVVDDSGKETIVNLTKVTPPVTPPKTEQPLEPAKSPAPAKAAAVKTVVIPTKVTDDATAVDPPTKTDIDKSAVGLVESKGEETAGNAEPGKPGGIDGGKGAGTGVDDGTEVYERFESMERLPQPVGGPQAWAKFLQKNLKYPSVALDEGVNGKVFLSFIIEKDGSLSNITVVRGGEYGFGEEALRVLKKAPAWTPGIQNGRPVRVKYSIPINFTLPE